MLLGNITNIDRIFPTATILFDTLNSDTSSSIHATIEQKDEISGIAIENCKWVYNKSNQKIGIEETNYTGGTFKNTLETITLKPSLGSGTYYLHILTVDKAGNKQETIAKEEIHIEFSSKAESLIKGIEAIGASGNYQINVKDETYSIHAYYFAENQIWNGTKTFGEDADIGTASTDATNMVVVKVDGNLTINSGAIVEPYATAYGGPKGFFLYVTGSLTNHGIIKNNKGGKADGQNVYLWKNENDSYEYVPKVGSPGGTSISFFYGDWDTQVGTPGMAGQTNASPRATGGGGSGAAFSATYGKNTTYSGAGGSGTSYSGGAGGGSGAHLRPGSPGSSKGGPGGNGPDRSSWRIWIFWCWKSSRMGK